MVHALIVGTGDHAHGLCHLFKNHNTHTSGNTLAVTKLNLEEGGTFHDTGVPLVNLDKAVQVAEIVILAIPAEALKAFVGDRFKQLQDKILVDVSNSGVRGEDLHSILNITEVRWVKAFNDIGAVDILANKPFSKKKIQSKMCSRSPQAIATLKEFAETSLGMDIKVVPIERYYDIAMHQNSHGEEWVKSAVLLIIIFLLTELYASVRYNVKKGYAWYHLPLQVTNKAVCWTSIYGFALCLLPGVLARLCNIFFADNLRDKSKWLRDFLAMRKHLGCLSLWFLAVHILMSLLLFNPAYYGKFFVDPQANASKMNSKGENSFFFGVLGAALFFILGIVSLPSVGSQMTNRQWQFVFGPVAWIALAFGTIHVLIMGVPGWSQQHKWPGNLPPITLTSTVFPLFVMGLKAFQVALSACNVKMNCSDPMHWTDNIGRGGGRQDDMSSTPTGSVVKPGSLDKTELFESSRGMDPTVIPEEDSGEMEDILLPTRTMTASMPDLEGDDDDEYGLAEV